MDGFLNEGNGATLVCDDCGQQVSSSEHHHCQGKPRSTVRRNVAGSPHATAAGLREIYVALDLIRSGAHGLSHLVGRNMEQRDSDNVDRIAMIANTLISRAMASHDKLPKGG